MHEHDPVTNWKDRLLEEGIIEEDDFKTIQREAGKEAEASAKFADESPYPDVSEITDDVYWEVITTPKPDAPDVIFSIDLQSLFFQSCHEKLNTGKR